MWLSWWIWWNVHFTWYIYFINYLHQTVTFNREEGSHRNVYHSQCIPFTMYTIHNVYHSQCIPFTMYTIHNVYHSQCTPPFTMYTTIHNVYHSQCIPFTIYTITAKLKKYSKLWPHYCPSLRKQFIRQNEKQKHKKVLRIGILSSFIKIVKTQIWQISIKQFLQVLWKRGNISYIYA